jgi:hypothetical protein
MAKQTSNDNIAIGTIASGSPSSPSSPSGGRGSGRSSQIQIHREDIRIMNRAQMATLASEIEQSRPIPEWDAVPELKRFKQEIAGKDGSKKKLTFDALVVAYKSLDQEIKFREGKKAELKESIEAAMLVCGEEKVLAEGYRIALITKQGSKKISAEKLLTNGVSADVIAKSMDVGKESTYVDIRRAKED